MKKLVRSNTAVTIQTSDSSRNTMRSLCPRVKNERTEAEHPSHRLVKGARRTGKPRISVVPLTKPRWLLHQSQL